MNPNNSVIKKVWYTSYSDISVYLMKCCLNSKAETFILVHKDTLRWAVPDLNWLGWQKKKETFISWGGEEGEVEWSTQIRLWMVVCISFHDLFRSKMIPMIAFSVLLI